MLEFEMSEANPHRWTSECGRYTIHGRDVGQDRSDYRFSVVLSAPGVDLLLGDASSHMAARSIARQNEMEQARARLLEENDEAGISSISSMSDGVLSRLLVDLAMDQGPLTLTMLQRVAIEVDARLARRSIADVRDHLLLIRSRAVS